MADDQLMPPEPMPGPPPIPPIPLPSTGSDAGFRVPPSGLSNGSVRPTGTPEQGIRRQGGITMMMGAVLVLVSLPLALITVSGAGLTRSVNQMGSTALWPAVISVFAFARGYSAIKPTSFRTTLPILSGAFITWAAYDRWSWVKDAQQVALGRPDIVVSAGIGFWVFCAGAALIVIGSLILQLVKPQPR